MTTFSNRQKRNSDTNSNDEERNSDVDSAGILYDARDKGEKSNNDCLTQATKDDQLDNIANDLNAEKHTDKDVRHKLATNSGWKN